MRSIDSITGWAGSRVAFLGVVAAMCLAPPIAHAADGRVQLNPKVAAAGNLPGDSAGYPITLSQSGSYVLTENLDLTGEGDPLNTTAIQVTADWVTIDLNGFSIMGTATCSTTSTTTQAGSTTCSSGTGIGVSAAGREGVTVRNGVVSGMGSHGIALGAGALVDALQLVDNGGDAVQVGEGSQVLDVVVQNAGADGIHCNGVCIVENARIVTVGSDGIEGASGTTGVGLLVDGCTVRYADLAAVVGAGAMLVRNCTAWVNGVGIVSVDRGTLIEGSTAWENNADGIRFELGTLVYGNTARGNDSDGIDKYPGGFGTLVLENASQLNSSNDLIFDVQQPYGLNALGAVPPNGSQLETNVCGAGAC